MKETPVYLFTGFLEAGKTKFIQETLEDKRFNNGERILLILCEEGLEEYNPSTFSGDNVYIQILENESDIQAERLEELQEKYQAELIVVEYNGMWMLDTWYQQMPQGWVIVQEFLFCDANTFVSYNTNMRQLVYDKLRSCELVVFNRCGPDVDRMALHKIVRAVSRRIDIAYEQPDGTTEYDDIEDPLPYDLDAPVVDIADRDYALFYTDLSGDMGKYDGKILHYKGRVAKSPKLPDDTFIFGRQMMSCCVNDIQFAGLICRWPDTSLLAKGEWVMVTAELHVKFHRGYGKRGPVLTAIHVEPCEKPEEAVAMIY